MVNSLSSSSELASDPEQVLLYRFENDRVREIVDPEC